MVEIRTKRLVMRPVALEDAKQIVETMNDFEVAKFLSTPPYPYRDTDAREWVDMQTGPDDPTNTNFTIRLHDGTYIGAVGICEDGADPELGFYVNRQHWGKGYVSEASSAAIEWLFKTTDTKTVVSAAYTFNPASLAVQAKLGFVETGSVKRMCNAQGKALPMVTTKLSRGDFNKVHVD